MPNIYNGSDDDLTFGEALIVLAQHVSFRSEQVGIEVEDAIRREFNMVRPAPDVLGNLADPRDQTLISQDEKIRALEAELARRKHADAIVAANEDTVARLQREIEEATARHTAQPAEPVDPRDARIAELEAQLAAGSGSAPVQRERLWIDQPA